MDIANLKLKAKAAVESFEVKCVGDHGFKKKLGEFFDELLSATEGSEETSQPSEPETAQPEAAEVQAAVEADPQEAEAEEVEKAVAEANLPAAESVNESEQDAPDHPNCTECGKPRDL